MTVGETVGIIGAIVGVAGVIIGVFRSWKAKAIKDAEREQRQSDQHEELKRELVGITKRLDEHNGYAEKFAQTAIAVAGVQKDIEWIKEKLK